jgi:hypothetical protein
MIWTSAALSTFCIGSIVFGHLCPPRSFGLSDDSLGLILGRLGDVALLAAVANCLLSVAAMYFLLKPHSAWLWIGLAMPFAVLLLYPAIATA